MEREFQIQTKLVKSEVLGDIDVCGLLPYPWHVYCYIKIWKQIRTVTLCISPANLSR